MSYRRRISEPRRLNILSGEFQNHDPTSPSLPRARFPGTTAQLFNSADGIWHEDQSIRVDYRTDRSQLIVFPVSEELSCCRLDPSTSISPFEIRSIAAVYADSGRVDLREHVGSPNCRLLKSSLGKLIVVPSNADPQLTIDLPSEIRWICLEISPFRNEKAPSSV